MHTFSCVRFWIVLSEPVFCRLLVPYFRITPLLVPRFSNDHIVTLQCARGGCAGGFGFCTLRGIHCPDNISGRVSLPGEVETSVRLQQTDKDEVRTAFTIGLKYCHVMVNMRADLSSQDFVFQEVDGEGHHCVPHR